MSLIEKSTCKITVKSEGGISEEKGTGFFINKNQILTCKHVIEKQDGNIIIEKCHNQNGEKLTAEIVDSCDLCDYALLQLNEDFESEHFLELCDSEIVEEERIEIFGYPNDEQGQRQGERLKGLIDRELERDNDFMQDISLNITGFAHNIKYNAFSGAPVINEYDQVTSVLKYQAVRSLSAVSVRKARAFLQKNDITLRPDQIASFELYNKEVFLGFEDRKFECEVESIKPIKALTPNLIIDTNKDELFYPKNGLNIGELISYLRKNNDVNGKLWKGWIQLLTYVEMLKGNYESSNNISIEITSSELYKKFGLIKSTRDIPIKVYLNFYFTEEESYFKVAQRSIHENKKAGVSRHSCNIFNSNIAEFGNNNNIVKDISNPDYSGPSIQDVKIGTLSMNQLNREVISSNSLNDVSINLKKIFEDAIKESK